MGKHLAKLGSFGILIVSLFCFPLFSEDNYSESPLDRAEFLIPIDDSLDYMDVRNGEIVEIALTPADPKMDPDWDTIECGKDYCIQQHKKTKEKRRVYHDGTTVSIGFGTDLIGVDIDDPKMEEVEDHTEDPVFVDQKMDDVEDRTEEPVVEEEEDPSQHPKLYGAYSEKDFQNALRAAEGEDAFVWLVFSAYGCPPCETALLKLRQLTKKKFKGKFTIIIAKGRWNPSSSEVAANAWWKKLVAKYGISRTPSMVLLRGDHEGKINLESQGHYSTSELFKLIDSLLK